MKSALDKDLKSKEEFAKARKELEIETIEDIAEMLSALLLVLTGEKQDFLLVYASGSSVEAGKEAQMHTVGTFSKTQTVEVAKSLVGEKKEEQNEW